MQQIVTADAVPDLLEQRDADATSWQAEVDAAAGYRFNLDYDLPIRGWLLRLSAHEPCSRGGGAPHRGGRLVDDVLLRDLRRLCGAPA